MKEASGIIFLSKDGSEVLLNLRAKDAHVYPDYWSIPGGAVEKNEDPEQTALRELEEEIGYKADKMHYLLSDVHSYGQISWLAHIYWGIYDGLQKIECLEGQEIRFFKMDELDNLQIPSRQNELIMQAKEEYKRTT